MNILSATCILLVITVLVCADVPSGKIRQCQCDETEKCRKEAHDKFKPCADKCLDNLKHPNWNAAYGRKCLEQKPNDSECFMQSRKDTCANEPDVLINVNETVIGLRGIHKRAAEELTEESANTHNHPSFFSFVRHNFEQNGEEYVKCMKECFSLTKRGECIRKLGCGIKKLNKAERKKRLDTCKSERSGKRHETCDCLRKAGMTNVQCEVKDDKAN
jgi:hypothetical protein